MKVCSLIGIAIMSLSLVGCTVNTGQVDDNKMDQSVNSMQNLTLSPKVEAMLHWPNTPEAIYKEFNLRFKKKLEEAKK